MQMQGNRAQGRKPATLQEALGSYSFLDLLLNHLEKNNLLIVNYFNDN